MEIEKIPEQVWLDLVTDSKSCQLEFLAANILLARLKLKVKQNPSSAGNCAVELRDLFRTSSHLPRAKKDLATIANGKGY